MSTINETTAVLANVVQLASDTLLEVLGPDVAHSIGDQQITATSVKSLIKAEVLRSGLINEVTNV